MLDREAWARQRLAAHAGRSFVVSVGPAASAFAIDDAGRVASTSPGDATPDLRLSVSPLDLPAFLADPTRWDRYVTAEGDPALATTLKELAPTLPWFVEQAFAGVLGNVVGQQVADTGRRLLAFPEYAAERLGASVKSERDAAREVDDASDRIAQHGEVVAGGARHDEQVPDEVRVAELRVEHEERDADRVREAAGREQDDASHRNGL